MSCEDEWHDAVDLVNTLTAERDHILECWQQTQEELAKAYARWNRFQKELEASGNWHADEHGNLTRVVEGK